MIRNDFQVFYEEYVFYSLKLIFFLIQKANFTSKKAELKQLCYKTKDFNIYLFQSP